MRISAPSPNWPSHCAACLSTTATTLNTVQRNHGRQIVGLSGHRFIGFVQNHDQVGNRAQGERVSHEAGVGRAKIAAALVLTAPFVPMLFQGEEFGASAPFLYFTDYEDPELGRVISEGRKKEFVGLRLDPGSDSRSSA